LFGEVHVEGLSLPRMRVLSPCATWLVAWPVWMATQLQGWVESQSVLGLDGHAVPVFSV